ncbi:hypothetical protein AVEN_3161-1 [Araneus ventricosus]|uniref:HTH CENPB-type domain-containing protein n=1 Tax=Araneus ventricosus TaxID=182803 RepID=A0A4Y2QHF6_ARAVE|nr:hypothetical protein AVEN_3161-1 [Araneus ventricosus]
MLNKPRATSDEGNQLKRLQLRSGKTAVISTTTEACTSPMRGGFTAGILSVGLGLGQTPRTSTDEASEDSFKASRGWFDNFRKRTGIHSVVRHGEAASSDVKAAEDYLKTFSELIEANGYIPQQVFNCDETGLTFM